MALKATNCSFEALRVNTPSGRPLTLTLPHRHRVRRLSNKGLTQRYSTAMHAHAHLHESGGSYWGGIKDSINLGRKRSLLNTLAERDQRLNIQDTFTIYLTWPALFSTISRITSEAYQLSVAIYIHACIALQWWIPDQVKRPAAVDRALSPNSCERILLQLA